MRAVVAIALTLAIAATLAACGDDESSADRVAQACAGASTGDAALHGSGRDISQRVHQAEQAAADAAHALPRDDAEAVRALLAQSLRLRLVRSQIARGSPAPQAVLDAAAAGLTGGDRITRERLAAAGVTC